MTAICSSCHRKTENVKALKGRAVCCGSWNSLVRVSASGDKAQTKRKASKAIRQ